MIKVLQKRSLKLKNIDILYDEKQSDTSAEFVADKVGRYPYVVFRGIPIETPDIFSLKIYNEDFLPKLEIIFRDPTSYFQDKSFPLDDDIISVFIRSTSEALNPIRMDFKIMTFNVIKSKPGATKGDLSYSMKCLLDVNHLYYTPYQSYKNMSSFNVLKKISDDAGLGFATNIDNTKDVMTWINPRTTNVEFIQDTVLHSYLNDSSFLLSFVDFYYNLNYIDIEKELNEDPTNLTQVTNDYNYFNPKAKDSIKPLKLTNHPDQENSSVFISQFNLKNSSTETNLEAGYQNIVRSYDTLNQNLLIHTLDTISTAGKDDNLIVLKNQPDKLDGLYKYNFKDSFIGKFDPENVHQNYKWAYQQNVNNVSYFQKISIKVILKVANFNFYRYQNIRLEIYRIGETNTNKQTYPLNERLTGNWIITGINYDFDKENGFKQEINLVRRDLTAYHNDSVNNDNDLIKNNNL